MRLPLRYFIVLCVLLGAIGLPWAWRVYQARRAAEILRLEKELGELWANEPLKSAFGTTLIDSEQAKDGGKHSRWKAKVRQNQDRLEKLTGVRPVRPAQEVPPKMGQPTALPSQIETF